MKTLLIGIFLIGSYSLVHAQDDPVGTVALEDVVISSDNIAVNSVNLDYIHKAVDDDTPTRVRDLEGHAARFDITEADEYDSKFDAYEVIFKEDNGGEGRVVATYDSEGKILKSYERFTNLMLPRAILSKVTREYPGWVIYKDTYLVSYYHGEDIDKVYKIQIKKGDERKNLKIGIDDNGKLK
ncbi:hypothetical protein [Mangrovimonas aestuarii]|uniref:hypothetical protein n=1 Tax=Mangrovimonas aestuarii TaxID=3018443 RepID=UPI0023788250|nr:hypothetical protein [Mangrovimonas aestuarii]